MEGAGRAGLGPPRGDPEVAEAAGAGVDAGSAARAADRGRNGRGRAGDPARVDGSEKGGRPWAGLRLLKKVRLGSGRRWRPGTRGRGTGKWAKSAKRACRVSRGW